MGDVVNRKISSRDLLDFTGNLSLLLNSGLSIHNSIQMIHSFSRKKTLLELTEYLDTGLKKGNSLSQLLEKDVLGFPPLYRGLVSIGDRIGSLSTILPTLKNYLERNKKIRDKVINASLYPLIVLTMLFAGILFLILAVLPKVEEIFSSLGNSEMQSAMLHRNIGSIQNLGLLFVAIVMILAFLIPLRRRFPGLKRRTDQLSLHIPGIRHIILSLELFNFTFSIETLTKHGIPLTTAIKEAVQVCRNAHLVEAFMNVHAELTSGKGLYRAFANQKVLPPRLIQWIGIGENTGQSGEVFGQLRIYYESEIENLTTRLLGIIEPLLIIFVGVVVISLIFTLVIPLFSLFGSVL